MQKPSPSDLRLSVVKHALALSNSAVIYYPGCGDHTGPACIFSENRVIHVDTNGTEVNKLLAKGFEAHQASVDTFIPDAPVTVMIQFNVLFPNAFELLHPNGYIICNNYHKTATCVFGLSNFTLLGVATSKTSNSDCHFDTQDLDHFFRRVESDEEYRRVALYLFERAQKAVSLFGGDTTHNILEQYRNIRKRGKEETGSSLFVKHPKTGQDLCVLPPPMKKGCTDDHWVFRKKA